MNRTRRIIGLGILAGACLSVLPSIVRATSQSWDGGGGNGNWNVNNNWSSNTTYPQGDDTATFNGGGANQTNINVSGLSGIKYITFDGSGVNTYNIGLAPANSQTLILRNDGNVRMSATCRYNQAFNAAVQLGPDKAGSTYTFQNDHAINALTLQGRVSGSATGGTAGDKAITVNGSGPIRFLGDVTRGNANNLDVNIYNTSTVTMTGTNVIRYLRLYGGAGSVLDIGDGLVVFTNSNVSSLGGENFRSTYGGTITGSGAMMLTTAPGENNSDNYVEDVNSTLFINCRLTGGVGFELYTGNGVAGTFALNGANDFTGNVFLNASGTLSANKFGNQYATDSGLGAGHRVRFNSWHHGGATLKYTGAGEASDRLFELGAHAKFEQAGSGHLTLTRPFSTVTTSGITIMLKGSTSGTAEISGEIANGSSSGVSLAKEGSGTWTLSAPNTFTGALTVNNGTLILTQPNRTGAAITLNGGTLALSGAAGAVTNASVITLAEGATLLLENSAGANVPDRVRDQAALTLTGGTLAFSHAADAASYSETLGTVAANSGNSTITASRAAAGQTSTLTLSGLTRTAGTLTFTGAGLGDSDRNRIFIVGQADGLIGAWATVNGTTPAAYSSTRGVYAAEAAAYTDIAARGPASTIPDAGANSAVRINSDGTSGAIALAAATTTLGSLAQNTATEAVVDTAGKTLRATRIDIPVGKAGITIGATAGDGTLAAAITGGGLALASDSSAPLTVNAVIADNTSASALSKSGSGAVVLSAANTFSGATTLSGGPLLLAHADALQNSIVTLYDGSPLFDASVSGHAFTFGGLAGIRGFALTDTAGNPVTLTVGQNPAGTTYSGALSGSGSLVKTGAGTLTLTGANTHSGGTTIHAGGTLAAGHAQALGTGPVINNGTLNLTLTPAIYSGLSTSLSGAGTNNVSLITGNTGNLTTLNGDYSGFTGVWNLGVNAGAGASRVQMNGRDNPAAAIIVRTNATLYVSSSVYPHSASISLQGGNTGEANGQLRLDNSARWEGPLQLTAPITDGNDGFFGCASGSGYVAGKISDGGGAYAFNKVGGGTLHLMNAENDFGGAVWVRAGWLRAYSMRMLGESSALGAPTSVANGTIKLGNGTTTAGLAYIGNGDTTDRRIDLASTTATCYLEHLGSNLWKITGDVISSGAGNKRLQLQGSSLFGTGELAGVISEYSASHTNNILKTGTGTWTLSGDNTFKGNVVVENGILRITHNRALGIGPKNAQAAYNANNANPHIHLDGSASNLTIPADITFRTSNQRAGALFNDAGTNTILGMVHMTSGDGDTAIVSSAGKLTLSGNVYPPTDTSRRLRLWGDGDGEIAGVIANGATSDLPLFKEKGKGTWALTGANTYSGATTVNDGILILGGADGRIAGTAEAATGGALIVTNSPDANNPDRLADGAGVVLNGGTLAFTHPGGAANYSEAAGALSVGSGVSTVAASRADEGQTSALTFASLTRTGNGSINFTGEGLGDADARNRILFTTPPVADNAVIGTWALYNGNTLASYTTERGVIAADDSIYSDLSAKGPSVLPNDGTVLARINSEGTEGGISLAGETANSLGALFQATAWEAKVGLTNGQTLAVSDLAIGVGMASLTVGTNLTDGLLQPLTAGGALTLANHAPGSALVINTPLTNNTSASSLVKVGSGPAQVNGVIAHTGATTINEGDLILAANTLTQALAGVISGNGNLVKEGTGRIDLNVANTYTGETVIRGGTLMPRNNAALGSTAGGTVVTNGGTLDLGFSGTGQAVNFGDEVFTVSGAGVNDRGAIINSSAVSQYNAFRFMRLAGDTTFGGENVAARWDLRNTAANPYLDMGGHTVTKVGSNMVGITSVPLLNPGHFDIRNGTLRTEALTLMNGSAANTMTVQNGATYEIYSMANPIAWSLIMKDGGRFASVSGNGVVQNVWTGPVALEGYSRFDSSGSTSATLAGEISGNGSLVKIGSSILHLTGTNNTYAGGTYISNNWLHAWNPGALPEYDQPDKVQVAPNAGLYVYAGDGTAGWSAEQLNALHSTGAFLASNSLMAVDTTYAPMTGLGGMNGFGLYKYGTNTLTLTGVNTNRSTASTEWSHLRVYGGRLVLDASSSNVYGRTHVQPGSAGGTLEINGPTRLQDLYVGNGGSDRSRVIINTNVTMNRAWVGIYQVANGVLIQNSGLVEVAPTTGSTTIFDIGRDGAYGYYRMNGGTLRAGQFALGGGSGNATTGNNGVFDLMDGAVNVTASSGWLIWGWAGGNGIANLFGGRLVAPPGGNQVSMAHTVDRNAFAMLNLLGPNAFLDTVTNSTSRSVNMANTAGNLMSVINLNAGTLLANRVYAGSTGTPSYFNFGGGRLLANGGTGYASTFLQGLTAATVYPGGAVIDVSNVTVTVNQPLLAPTGWGVASIPISHPGAGYIGAPVVMISGGSGTGATAIAQVDMDEGSATFGQLTGVIVTSPGSGYQPGDALTVSLIRGGYTTLARVGAPALAPNVSGGLTKLGSGTLTLGGASTYGGETVISNGTLKLGNALALPAASKVLLAGGTLDLGGYTVTNAVGGLGTLANGTLQTVISPAGEGVLGAESLTVNGVTLTGTYRCDVTETGASDHVTFAGSVGLSGLTLEIVDPESLSRSKVYTIATITGARTGGFLPDSRLDSRWRLAYAADGTVKLLFVDGTFMFVK
ncbi:MAG: hypothetical protein GX565_08650 [Lentisphaerae bacterium]|nr:hypothetical protein [Lentisphaerota bacterium]